LPSRSEGFPNALIEAMAAGVASVSFDINAGPSDIINHGKNGLLVPDGHIHAMADNIQMLIDDEKYRFQLGKEAEKIKEKLSLKEIGKQFEDFILNSNDK
jgi:glycosyltransferase involved in cell wall biosynthesis